MHIYQKLTDEQIKLNNRNNRKARLWFKRNGFMPDPNLTYDLHHIDETLRTTNIERYIEWRIEDLEVIEHSEHAKRHAHFKCISKEDRSKITLKM